MKSILLLLALSLMVTLGLPGIDAFKYRMTNIFTEQDLSVNEEAIDVDAQIAILLDTSGSMNGLIEQAKSQLWNIVNELSEARRHNEPIRFQIALYEYGTQNSSITNPYIRQVVDFTSDIDLISQKLFSLSTSGSEEHCGEVIEQSLSQLTWSSLAKLKTIYIAGNESFAQGRTSYRKACAFASQNNIVVNTIFCGPLQTGIDLQWKTGASLTNGDYFNIDQNQKTRYYDTPYDVAISDLNEKLNDTYIHYGKGGSDFLQNQKYQDQNARSYGASNAASRSVFKSNKQYNNAQWDLVDAYENDKRIIGKAKELPKEYRDLNTEDLEEQVKKTSLSRKSIQTKIANLSTKRKKYITQLKREDDQGTSLDESINTSMRDQAKKAGLTYPSDHKEQASLINFNGFIESATDVEKHRKDRLISTSEFNKMSKEKNTIILDTRSKKAFDERHVKGAIHLNFSDFTEEKLTALIPDSNTRILIYCNNNFISTKPALALKMPPLALNIPTFINLYGYGYKNIYELKSLNVDNGSVLEMSSSKK